MFCMFYCIRSLGLSLSLVVLLKCIIFDCSLCTFHTSERPGAVVHLGSHMLEIFPVVVPMKGLILL